MFNLFSIGKNALMLNEQHLNAAGHNISNVNTPGYSRQRIVQTSAYPVSDGQHSYGTGVQMARIERMRDQQLDVNYREKNSEYSYWESLSRELNELDAGMQEPGEDGLTYHLNEFFKSWESLANNPSDMVHRADLLEKVNNLCGGFQRLDDQIETRHDEANQTLGSIAGEVNAIASELASLNVAIHSAEHGDSPANDLRDRFDTLIDELSEYGDVNVQVRESDGTTVVYFGAGELVKHDQVRTLSARHEERDGKDYTDLIWTDTRSELSGINKGEIAGTLALRDDYLTKYQDKLDNLANQLVERVNGIHVQGHDLDGSSGRLLFDPATTGAGDIALSTDLSGHPERIAASQDGEEGDNRIALMITDLKDEVTMDGRFTFSGYFGSILGEVGRDTLTAQNMNDMNQSVTEQINNFRESVKGVSMNEETANLLKYQQAFQAAAQVVQMAENVLSAVIGMTR